MEKRKVNGLHIGKTENHQWHGKEELSAINKKGVLQAFLTKEGFEGDGVANLAFHGGPERAVCLYPAEHYGVWETEFKKVLQRPGFGENISCYGMQEDEVLIGDTYKLGEAVIQISQGRIPCAKISNYNELNPLLKRVIQTGATGYFFRVLEEGMVHNNDTLELLHRPNESVSILFANQIWFHDRGNKEGIEQILRAKDLAPVWRQMLQDALKL